MDEDGEEGGGRIEAGRSREKSGKGSTGAHEAGRRTEAPAQDAGLSETEKIGRSLDEVSDIIHDVLYESKDSDSGAGDGEAAAGPAAERGAGANAGQGVGYEKARTERPAAGAAGGQPEAERPAEGRERTERAAAGAAGGQPEAERQAGGRERTERPAAGAAGGQPEAERQAAEAEEGPERSPDEAAPDRAGEKIGEGEPEGERQQGESPNASAAAEKVEAGGEPNAEAGGEDRIPNPVIESILGPSEADEYGGGSGSGQGGRAYSYDDFIDERVLISRDAFGRKEMKIKVLEVSDEKAPTSWKLGDRVKVDKILVTVKHLETQQVEECEFDIESIEKEIARDRHYSSTNRWVPTTDIKNGYVAGSRHTSLISDAVALEYIIF